MFCFQSKNHFKAFESKKRRDCCERGLLDLSSMKFSPLYLKPLIQTQGILRGTIDKRLYRSQAPQAAILIIWTGTENTHSFTSEPTAGEGSRG